MKESGDIRDTHIEKETTMARKPRSEAVKAAADRAEKRARGEPLDKPKVPIDPPVTLAEALAREERRDPRSGRFLPGNKFWLARSSAGPKPKFTDPDALWTAACEYFEWVEDNPLWEDKLVTFQGTATHEPTAKMRAMTLAGLCLFLDIDRTTWAGWKCNRPDLLSVITRAEEVIFAQKFAGAAADLLNANIIARDLGLADKSELTGKDGGAIKFDDVSDIEKARRIAFALGRVYHRTPQPEEPQPDPAGRVH
jgi:hypothetical protein